MLKHAIGAVKAWHQRLGMAAPADGPGDYRRLTTSLARFQPCPRMLKFPIPAAAVRRLLLLPFPTHPPCGGVIPPKVRGKWVRCLLGLPASLVRLHGQRDGHDHLLSLQGARAHDGLRCVVAV